MLVEAAMNSDCAFSVLIQSVLKAILMQRTVGPVMVLFCWEAGY